MSSTMLDQRREALFQAAADFVFNGKTVEGQRVLCDAASEYHKERVAHFKPQQNQEAAQFVIPWGRTKGTPIGEAETKDLNFVVTSLRERLDDPKNAKYRSDNLKLIAAIERELGTR